VAAPFFQQPLRLLTSEKLARLFYTFSLTESISFAGAAIGCADLFDSELQLFGDSGEKEYYA
jgi:hypothetical protein